MVDIHLTGSAMGYIACIRETIARELYTTARDNGHQCGLGKIAKGCIRLSLHANANLGCSCIIWLAYSWKH